MPILDDLAAVVATRIKESNARVRDMEQEIRRARAEVELLITRELAHDRERLAALEARPPAPGPPGADGAAGKDGLPGPPGPKGDPGVQWKKFVQGSAYTLGDQTTWDGGLWHCNKATTDKPGTSDAWTLIVKRGDVRR